LTLPNESERPPLTSFDPRPAVTRTEGLGEQWRAYFRRVLHEQPAHPAARDFMADDLRQALTRLIPGDASVLEVGCGTGDLLSRLPQQRRVGVDMLPEVVEEARRRHPDIDFQVGDAAQLGADAQLPRFDAIICDRLVHSAGDIRALLVSLRARLSDTGRLYLTAFNYLWELPTRMAELMGWKLPAPTSNWLSETDFKNLFELAGLEVVRFEDRLLLPIDLPGVSATVNRYVAKLPGWQRRT
jgi:SAM-dependent methyltransferase